MLITLEGIDGTGKTSIIRKLKKSYRNIVFTKEPYKLRKKQYPNKFAELFAFVIDHERHLRDIINPSIENGYLVISDRYYDSRCAYQGVNIDMDYIKELHKPFTVKPDLTILLIGNPVICLNRKRKKDKFEKKEFLEKVQQNYLKLTEQEPDRFYIVSANQNFSEVYRQVENVIKRKLNGYNYWKV